MRSLHDIVSDYDALVFSDEIHSPLVLDEQSPFVSYASLGPSFASHTVTATAASKGWNIAGLPSAQVILPDEALRERWDVFAADVRHDANVIGTVGAIAAYERGDTWQREVKDLIRSNVDLVERSLADTPIDFVRPEGTYLTWWGFEGVDLGPLSPAATLRERARIAANDGPHPGRGLRLVGRASTWHAPPTWPRGSWSGSSPCSDWFSYDTRPWPGTVDTHLPATASFVSVRSGCQGRLDAGDRGLAGR